MASSDEENTDEGVRPEPRHKIISSFYKDMMLWSSDSEDSKNFSKSSMGMPSGNNLLIKKVLASLSKVDPKNIQEIAASQITLLTSYYQVVLSQAEKSFRWAVIAAGVGLVFFIASISVLLVGPYQNISLLGVISGAVVEVIAGINFYLYNKATGQLADFHARLDSTQRILLANSLCESLSQQRKDDARVEIIRQVVGIQRQDAQSTVNEVS